MKQTARIVGMHHLATPSRAPLLWKRAGTLTLLIGLTTPVLTGCGLKGPLYLPATAASEANASSASAPHTP